VFKVVAWMISLLPLGVKVRIMSAPLYVPTAETMFERRRRTSSAVDRRAGLPVRSIEETGLTAATSTRLSIVSSLSIERICSAGYHICFSSRAL